MFFLSLIKPSRAFSQIPYSIGLGCADLVIKLNTLHTYTVNDAITFSVSIWFPFAHLTSIPLSYIIFFSPPLFRFFSLTKLHFESVFFFFYYVFSFDIDQCSCRVLSTASSSTAVAVATIQQRAANGHLDISQKK